MFVVAGIVYYCSLNFGICFTELQKQSSPE